MPEAADIAPEEITRQSKSNLAFALSCLPPARRDDMVTFYAFCRVIDDIADDPGIPEATRRQQLNEWRREIASHFTDCNPALGRLAPALAAVVERNAVAPQLLLEIIDGVEMDIDEVTFDTFEDLRAYCYRVASAVGLVSIEIFGCTQEGSKEYAEQLGYALQLTNIMRDVGEDLANEGRIYLPLGELEQFGYSQEKLRARVYDDSFVAMMEHQHARATKFYAAAARALPPQDRPYLIAAEAMGQIYGGLLKKMHKERYRVFDQRYSLSKFQKGKVLASAILKGWLARR